MRRIIKYNSIAETASNMLIELNTLKDQQAQLLKDIDTIRDSYQGIDAEGIITQYTKRVNYLNEYINNMIEYQKYFEWISGSYKESHEKIRKDLVDLVEPVENEIVNDPFANFDVEKMAEEGEKSIWVI